MLEPLALVFPLICALADLSSVCCSMQVKGRLSNSKQLRTPFHSVKRLDLSLTPKHMQGLRQLWRPMQTYENC
jgi:hypothetical protein